MTLKANISRNVSAADVPNRVSREFHRVVDARVLTGGPYTVLAFPGMRGASQSIVDSKTLTKALRKCVVQDEQIVAVAHKFTSEARGLLNEIGAIFFQQPDPAFLWTDESWAQIRGMKAGSRK